MSTHDNGAYDKPQPGRYDPSRVNFIPPEAGSDDMAEPSVQIDMRGVPVGPYHLGRHVYGEDWYWFDGKHFRWPRCRWRWLCVWRNRHRQAANAR